jgi:YfiH family protein
MSDYTGVLVPKNTVPRKKSHKQKGAPRKKSRGTGSSTQNRSHEWSERRTAGARILQTALGSLPWLAHGFSLRPGGSSLLDGERVLNLGFMEWDERERVLENRRRLQRAVGAQEFFLASLKQFHSDVVHVVRGLPPVGQGGTGNGGVPHADAAITDRAGVLLAVQTADCVPILLVDPRRRSIGAVHAGWRGALQRIVAKTIGQMRMQFGSRAEDLLAAIGPSVGGCCYEVGAEVAARFQAQFERADEWFDELRTGDEPNPLQWLNQMPPGHQPPPKNVLLDLKKANRAQLLDAGLREANIFVSELCTACRRDLLFSYRKEGARTGRMMAVIGIRRSSGSAKRAP